MTQYTLNTSNYDLIVYEIAVERLLRFGGSLGTPADQASASAWVTEFVHRTEQPIKPEHMRQDVREDFRARPRSGGEILKDKRGDIRTTGMYGQTYGHAPETVARS